MSGRRGLSVLALVAFLALVAACAAALRQPSAQDAALVAPQWPGTTVKDLARGRRLYVNRCSGCHTLVLPKEHPSETWPGLVDAMAERAKLGPGERDDIARFLVAVAADERPEAR